LLDLGEVVVHVFQVEIRPFYAIERLWDMAETPV
jgi:ribosomal silencing factor RsfS